MQECYRYSACKNDPLRQVALHLCLIEIDKDLCLSIASERQCLLIYTIYKTFLLTLIEAASYFIESRAEMFMDVGLAGRLGDTPDPRPDDTSGCEVVRIVGRDGMLLGSVSSGSAILEERKRQ